MFFSILISFLSLIGLVIIHEFGHFFVAKKFGVKVEEFGIGYPPRLFGKKIGETIYSLNLFPFGAFVKIPGEIERTDNPRHFSNQKIWKRVLIVLAGVFSFWIVATVLFGILSVLGIPNPVSDEESDGLLKNAVIRIMQVLPDSPAEKAGIKPGDALKQLTINNQQLMVNKIKEFQELIDQHKGEEIVLTIERGKEIFDVSLIPRVFSPANQGPIGVVLIKTSLKFYPWYQAPWQGFLEVLSLTKLIIQGYIQVIKNLTSGQPAGVELMGPVGIFHLFTQISRFGLNYFFHFVGTIAVYMALFNILPIPAFDGGKLLFLGIEAIRRKPINEKTEEKITIAFFGFLIILMIWVTIKDIVKLF